MNITDAQRQSVVSWLQQGLKLAEVQKRLETDFDLHLTYMEVKLLVSELAVLPKDTEPTRPPESLGGPAPDASPSPARPPSQPSHGHLAAPASQPAPAAGKVQVSVDQITRPGSMASGGVTFSDGKTGLWYVDQLGRLGVAPKDKGYRPSSGDMQEFQLALDQQLARLGF